MTPGEALLIGALVTFGVGVSLGAAVAVWILWKRGDRQGALLARGLRAMADSLDAKDLSGSALRGIAGQVERGPVTVPGISAVGKPRILRPLTDAEEGALEERRSGADLADPERKRKNERIVAKIRQEEPV